MNHFCSGHLAIYARKAGYYISTGMIILLSEFQARLTCRQLAIVAVDCMIHHRYYQIAFCIVIIVLDKYLPTMRSLYPRLHNGSEMQAASVIYLGT